MVRETTNSSHWLYGVAERLILSRQSSHGTRRGRRRKPEPPQAPFADMHPISGMYSHSWLAIEADACSSGPLEFSFDVHETITQEYGTDLSTTTDKRIRSRLCLYLMYYPAS
jgi:hypothetical protein